VDAAQSRAGEHMPRVPNVKEPIELTVLSSAAPISQRRRIDLSA